MASGGRVIFWACRSSGLALLSFAIYIALAWPETPPDPLDTGWMSLLRVKAFVALSVAWFGVCVLALGLLVRGLFD
jgi:hypothetical protein